jgi:hypothetical protein
MGPGICLGDGHCASDTETIYVQNSASICSNAADGGAGGGTKAHPFCDMGPVGAALSSTRDLVIVIGLVQNGSWTYANQAPAGLTIIGQQLATIAGGTSPAFAMQSGSVLIKNILFSPSPTVCISATGGTLNLDTVTVDSCKGGGILLNGAAFDIENTTVSNNGIGHLGATNWGGILYNAVPASGPTKLNLVSLVANKAEGLSCAGAIAGTGVLANGNTGGDVQDYCGITLCTTPGLTCGAQ